VTAAVFAMSPATLGVLMGTMTAGFALGGFVSGRIAGRHALTTMMIAGRLVACLGLAAGLLLFLAGALNLATLFGPCVLAGFGNGLTMPSASAGTLSVRPGLAGSASGLAGALTVGGGGAIAGVSGALLTAANGPYALLGAMLAAALAGLLAALCVLWIDRGEGLPAR
jgi:MFS family permease